MPPKTNKKVEQLKRYLVEAYPDPRPEHALCGLLDEIVEEAVVEAKREEQNKLSYWLEHKATCFLFNEAGSSDYCTCGLTETLANKKEND